MRKAPIAFAAALLSTAGCGFGGGGGGGGGETGKTVVFPHALEVSGRIRAVAIGDVNGDGIADLFLHHPDSASVAVHLSSAVRESPTRASTGRESPTLASKGLARGASAYRDGVPHVFVWDSAADLGLADLDGDGRPDLVVAGGTAGQVGVWTSRSIPENSVEFDSPVVLDVGGSADAVAAGDVNGDGMVDLVVLDESSGQARVLLRSPSTTPPFVVGNDPPVIGACAGLVLVDVDRDGDLDIVTNRPDVDAVAFATQDAAAGWAIRESPTLRSHGRSMAVGDVDCDGFLDVVVLVEGGAEVVCLVQRSSEPGVFDAVSSPLGISIDEPGVHVAQVLPPPRTAGASRRSMHDNGVDAAGISIDEPGVHRAGMAIRQEGLALADLDRDGRLDIVVGGAAGGEGGGGSGGAIYVANGTSTPGTFDPGAWLRRQTLDEFGIQIDGTGQVCAVADLDEDGHLDVVRCDTDERRVSLIYVEDGTPAAPEYSQRWIVDSLPPIIDMASADFDRDGLLDIVTATPTGIEVRFQESPGVFLSPLRLGAAPVVTVAVGDVNGDGLPDLVASTAQSPATFLRDPAAARQFLPPVPFPPPPPGGDFRSLQLGDVDGDGFLDCVAIRESPSKASLGRGMGNGFFDVFTEIDVAVLDPMDVAIADLDGDGLLDLAVCGTDSSAVVLQEKGFPVKWEGPGLLVLQGGVSVAAGDVDGDGRLDVVTSGDVGVLVALQGASGAFLPAYALSTESCGGLALCDVDRNGMPDACFVETKTGTLVCRTATVDESPPSVRLNGLPPGVPVTGTLVLVGDVDGDCKADILTACPTQPGLATGALRQFSDSP